jgi:hypothetical protein
MLFETIEGPGGRLTLLATDAEQNIGGPKRIMYDTHPDGSIYIQIDGVQIETIQVEIRPDYTVLLYVIPEYFLPKYDADAVAAALAEFLGCDLGQAASVNEAIQNSFLEMNFGTSGTEGGSGGGGGANGSGTSGDGDEPGGDDTDNQA